MIDAEKIEELRGLLAAVEAFDQMETFDWFAKRSAELNLRAAIEPHYRSLLDLATTAEAQVERLRAENERLRVALEESDKQQVWQDGFDAARKMVESVTSRATWGPKATLHDAYQLGMDAVKGVFKRADLRRARTALEGKTDGE